jgi:hypothetical protein
MKDRTFNLNDAELAEIVGGALTDCHNARLRFRMGILGTLSLDVKACGGDTGVSVAYQK